MAISPIAASLAMTDLRRNTSVLTVVAALQREAAGKMESSVISTDTCQFSRQAERTATTTVYPIYSPQNVLFRRKGAG